ncbi:hypothetical protein COCON_G00201930 [Conger conger]|uniref:SFR19-like C-terminal domain-containing protein n=1 Tax=Conger conger TaxID=82655 RepID=A0A9Q1HPW8_CONCO|nr:hypothetical protein COCON_G00201930 [Conger conger]
MGEEDEFDQVDAGRPKSKQGKGQREEEGEKEEKRESPRRCLGRREAPGDHHSQLGSAASVVSESVLPPVSPSCSPHQSFDSVDFHVELTAEVRLEGGSSFALLSSVNSAVQTRKSGAFTHRLPSLLNHPSLSWRPRLKGHLVDTCRSPCRSPASLLLRPCDISKNPPLERRTPAASPPGVVVVPNKTPRPSSPSTPPSSAPSSPSSSPSSASPDGTVASYHDDSRARGGGGAVANGTGDPVSSTSTAPLLPLSDPAVHTSSASSLPTSEGEQESMGLYDPFCPLAGEEEEEQDGDTGEEGEKYDPFDPTGSPDSEMTREQGAESEGGSRAESEGGSRAESEGGSSPDNESREPKLIPGGMEAETEEEEDGRGMEGKDTPPPDPTHPPASTCTPSPPPRHREEREREAERADRKGATEGRRHRKEANDSDNSEIEEGEIVGVGEKERPREREREKKRKREMGRDKAFLLSSPKVERILRVLDGDEFVSVRAEGDWLAGGDGDSGGGSAMSALGDLRTKLLNRRRERYRPCPSSSLSPPPRPPSPSHLPPLPAPSEKRKSRKSSMDPMERERHKRKDEQGEEKVDLNCSDLYAIKRTITVTTTTTTTTVPGSPRPPKADHSSPPRTHEKPRKKKQKRRQCPAEEDEEEHRQISLCRDLSLTPPRPHSCDSDRFSDKLPAEGLSALPPHSSPKHKPKSQSGRRAKKKSQLSKQVDPSGAPFRTKPSKDHASLSPPPSPSFRPTSLQPAPLPVKKRRKSGKEREKGGKKEGSRSGSSRKRKLQSKVSVLVRDGVSSTTGVLGGVGKLGVLGGVGKELSVPAGGGSGGVVGGSIAVVFRRDNESRSPFLKPCSDPIAILGRSSDIGNMQRRCTLAPPSSQLSALKPKKAKPSSTTSASSSSASSPSSSSATRPRRKQGKRGKEGREKGRGGPAEEGEELSRDGSWGVSGMEIQAGVAVSSKSCSPPPCHPTFTPLSSPASNAVPSSPPLTPLLSLPPSHDTRQSTPDSQTVDSSCRTPEASFLLEDCMSQTQVTPLAPSSNAPTSPLPPQTSLGGACHKPPPPPPPPAPPLPWSLQTGVDCTAGGVLALTALLFKMEEANVAGRAKAHEFIQATSQILSQANQSQSQHPSASSSSSTSSLQAPSLPSLPPPPAQFILRGSLPLVGSTKPGLSLGSGCAQTPPAPMHMGPSGGTGGSSETGWDSESKDPDKYLKKLHTQERAVEEVKLAIKPYYQRKDINKDEYKDILRKAVHKICHSRTGEINPVKVSNLVKLYVQRYKYFRKHGRSMEEEEREGEQTVLYSSSS